MERLKTDLKNFNKGGYVPSSRIKWFFWFVASSLFVRSYQPFYFIRAGALRLFGAKIGTGVVLKPGLIVKFPWFLEIGDEVWIGEKTWIENQGMVRIGSHSCLSQGAMLITGNHNYKKVSFDLIVKGITIEDGVWIGARATVCPGVICRSHSVLAVSSVAVSDMEPYSVYQGNPAVKIKERAIA